MNSWGMRPRPMREEQPLDRWLALALRSMMRGDLYVSSGEERVVVVVKVVIGAESVLASRSSLPGRCISNMLPRSCW